MYYSHSLQLLLVSAVVASGLICPNATRRSTSFFAFTVELLYGRNTTCSEDEELNFRDAINSELTSMNFTKSDGLPQVVNGDICTDDNSTDNSIFNRSLVVIRSYTWTGRARCRVCSPDKKLRRLDQESVAEDAARSASLALTNMMTITFVDDPQSCLHQDWATVVVVTITEVTQKPKDPCE